MKIQLVTKPFSDLKGETLILPMFEGFQVDFNFPEVKAFLKFNPKFGKSNEIQFLVSQDQKLLLVGAGKQSDFSYGKLQDWAGTGVKTLLSKTDNISLVLPTTPDLSFEQAAEAVAIGTQIATHDLALEYKSEKEPNKLKNLQIVVEKNDRAYSEGLKRGQVLAESINLAKRLGDLPPNVMTPSYFLKAATDVAKGSKLKLTVIDEPKAKKMGLAAFGAIAAGSDQPSFMIALEYLGNIKSKEKWGLVGKGVTFDSGGISIKPGNGMHEMKYDMCGAAVVLAVMQIIARLGLRVNAIGVCAVTENLLSGKAVKPGDIIKSYSGKTAEILNTDAEGRVVLIDGLTLAQKDFKATKLIDLATLTGAMIVALGDYTTGVFGNDSKFAQSLIAAGAGVGEKFWEMPMGQEYDEMIKSDFADMTNIGHGGSMPGAAGAIAGAKFIQQVIEDGRPWLHLDIAGTAWDMKPKPFRGPGATGVGIKTLIELIDNKSS